jgi:hypothetical protein
MIDEQASTALTPAIDYRLLAIGDWLLAVLCSSGPWQPKAALTNVDLDVYG